jgi:hypothetical protein
MNVKIHLEVSGSVVSAEGDVDFVKGIVDQWQHLLNRNDSIQNIVDNKSTNQGVYHQVLSSGADEQYDNVFARHNDRLKIIADVPNSSKAEATRTVALILLYGEHMSGIEQVSADKIKEACVDHGCYDNKNFASHLKSLKSKIVMDPKPGGDYTVKLTAPGRKFAKELIERLNQ